MKFQDLCRSKFSLCTLTQSTPGLHDLSRVKLIPTHTHGQKLCCGSMLHWRNGLFKLTWLCWLCVCMYVFMYVCINMCVCLPFSKTFIIVLLPWFVYIPSKTRHSTKDTHKSLVPSSVTLSLMLNLLSINHRAQCNAALTSFMLHVISLWTHLIMTGYLLVIFCCILYLISIGSYIKRYSCMTINNFEGKGYAQVNQVVLHLVNIPITVFQCIMLLVTSVLLSSTWIIPLDKSIDWRNQ